MSTLPKDKRVKKMTEEIDTKIIADPYLASNVDDYYLAGAFSTSDAQRLLNLPHAVTTIFAANMYITALRTIVSLLKIIATLKQTNNNG